MNKFYKVYLTTKEGKMSKHIANNKADVMKILAQAKIDGFYSYLIIQQIDKDTDVPIARGNFYEECKVKLVENLKANWKVVGTRVVDLNRYKENEENER